MVSKRDRGSGIEGREVESRRDRDRDKVGQTTDTAGNCEDFSTDSEVGVIIWKTTRIVRLGLVWLSWVSLGLTSCVLPVLIVLSACLKLHRLAVTESSISAQDRKKQALL